MVSIWVSTVVFEVCGCMVVYNVDLGVVEGEGVSGMRHVRFRGSPREDRGGVGGGIIGWMLVLLRWCWREGGCWW